jgi:hypothetical protein
MNPNATKEKLAKGFSYPLKRSVLDAALLSAQLNQLPLIRFYSQRNDLVMWAWFPGEANRGVHGAGTGLTQLFIYAVPSPEHQNVEQKLIAQGLPALCSWLQKSEAAGSVWRSTEHSFRCRLIDNELKVSYD